jgi:para-nitrobenzyl esterase
MNKKNSFRFRMLGLILILALTAIPLSYASANQDWFFGSNLVDPIKTESGYVSGTTIDSIYVKGSTAYGTYEGRIGEIGEKIRIYRGIPYAAPPVGALRWKPPQPVTPWQGIRECTKFCPMAPQAYPASSVYESIPLEGMSEDCLYLNLQTPAKNANERLPVMVLFHGGGLTTGSVNRFGDNCPPLPQHGVVSVTVQHRIGPFGYMAHPELTLESPHGASGNYGQLDLIAALQWVKRNIAAFGGDPKNVTIWGHSGGGSKTNFTLASPLAKGLFHRAISEAGFSTGGTPLATAEQYGVNLMNKVGAANISEMREKPWKEIIDVINAGGSGYATVQTVDGWSLPDTIGNIYTAGMHSDVPYMVGSGGAEITAASPARGQLLLTMSNKQQSPIYTYVFTHVPKNWAEAGVYAYHGLEVSYQYGVIDTVMRIYGTSLLPASPSVPPDPGVNEEDYWLQDAVMTMWTNFAATGDPTPRKRHFRDRLITWNWPEYDSRDLYLDIGVPPLVKTGFSTITTKQPPR